MNWNHIPSFPKSLFSSAVSLRSTHALTSNCTASSSSGTPYLNPTMRGHYYQVEYDRRAPTGSRGAMYAAIELEPVERCVDGIR